MAPNVDRRCPQVNKLDATKAAHWGINGRDDSGRDARRRNRRAGRAREVAAGIAADAPRRARAKCWSRSPPPGSIAPTCSSEWGSIRRRRARATSPGSRSAGTVVAAGAGATHLIGTRVCALVAGGGYAEYCVAPAGHLPARPRSAAPDRGGGAARDIVHRVGQSVRARLCRRRRHRARPRRDQRHRHDGDQVGRACSGSRSSSPAASDEKCAAALELGAAHAINYRTADFVEAVQRLTEGKGVAVVLDMVGGDYVPRNLDCLGRRRPPRLDRLPARRRPPKSPSSISCAAA